MPRDTLKSLTAAAVQPEYSVITPELIAAREVVGYRHMFSAADVAKATKICDRADTADMDHRSTYLDESEALVATMDEFTKAYVISALWLGVEYKHGDPRSDSDRASDFEPDDIEPETLKEMISDCADFLKANRATIDAAIATGEVVYGPDFGPMGRAGHDFWLTRNGHGAGFWDGDWPEPMADTLSEAARECGEYSLMMGDAGGIYGDAC